MVDRLTRRAVSLPEDWRLRLETLDNPRARTGAVSIVVPTRNEAENICELVRRIEEGVPDVAEIIFVDDSEDDTPAVIEAVAASSPLRIISHHRPPERRSGGLGGAVVEGFRGASAPWVCVMDADLQHPPELVGRLLRRAGETESDLVLASRHCDDGDGRSLGVARSLLSKTSAGAAHVLFPDRLDGVTDPMSGFFLVRRDALQLDALRPNGFKILLEILVRTPGLRVAEVPYEFGRRHAGSSKASLVEGIHYVTHLLHLRFGERRVRLAQFALVGATGLVVNTLLLAAFAGGIGFYYLLAAALATQGSTTWNFALTETWVFHGRRHDSGWRRRLLFFALMNNLALLARIPLLVVLVSGAGIHLLAANILSFVAVMLLRYAVSDRIIWSSRSAGKEGSVLYTYNIHGIITIESQVRLPELAQFRVSGLLSEPTMRVRAGRLPPSGRPASRPVRAFTYKEWFGWLGFAIDVRVGEQIDIGASTMLRHSPHVLYTNVVEPILRWSFVERGYALVHAACLADGERALLVTARTDTGKTTTVLKTLDRHPYAFLSDDLVLVDADGRLLPYPKPLTISRHTLSAVRTPLLNWRERLGLVFQSRIHSRSGRKTALWLTQSRLPMATVNAVVQYLVPPPKYPVQRLVPGVHIARGATIGGLVIIERGGQGGVRLGSDTALDILMENCEDAYGFPPYHAIERFLHSGNGQTLRPHERRLVRDALRGRPAWLLRSSTMDWAERLPSIMAGVPPLTEAEPASALPEPASVNEAFVP